ncbi:MAG: sodium:calcium antiporter [Spirochaetaceae bacterium]|nr:MAG: sodium:calcium antiporter [Spirochaetaceae bacterium]
MRDLLHPLLMILSFAPLLGGAELVVRGASALASRLRIAPIVVGLTLVAFGTSLPELVINISAALRGQPTIALGNVLGSNIFNIAASLGILSIIRTLPISRRTTWAEIPVAFLAALVMTLVAPNAVTRLEGLLLVSLFLLFLLYVALTMRRQAWDMDIPGGTDGRPVPSRGGAAILILVGLGILALGGEGVVRGAVGTARLLHVPEYVIAATVVAIGTSLPELVTGIVAIRRGEIDLAVGNVVGSNIFNVFFVLGTNALIRPIETIPRPFDHAFHILTTVMLFLFVFTGRGRQIERWEGVLLILVYGAYSLSLLLFTG